MGRPRTTPLPSNVPAKLPKGVYWLQGAYVAQVYDKPNRCMQYLGRFATPEDAAVAVKRKKPAPSKKPGPPKIIGPAAPKAGQVRRIHIYDLEDAFSDDAFGL